MRERPRWPSTNSGPLAIEMDQPGWKPDRFEPRDRRFAEHDRGRGRAIRIDTAIRNDRSRAPGTVHGTTGPGVDQVMEIGAIARSPAPHLRARRGKGAAIDGDDLAFGVEWCLAILRREDPPTAIGRLAGRCDVAAQTHQ